MDNKTITESPDRGDKALTAVIASSSSISNETFSNIENSESQDEIESQIENEMSNPQEKEYISSLEEEELLKDTEDPIQVEEGRPRAREGGCAQTEIVFIDKPPMCTQSQEGSEPMDSTSKSCEPDVNMTTRESEPSKSSDNPDPPINETDSNFEEPIVNVSEDGCEENNAKNPLEISGSDSLEDDHLIDKSSEKPVKDTTELLKEISTVGSTSYTVDKLPVSGIPEISGKAQDSSIRSMVPTESTESGDSVIMETQPESQGSDPPPLPVKSLSEKTKTDSDKNSSTEVEATEVGPTEVRPTEVEPMEVEDSSTEKETEGSKDEPVKSITEEVGRPMIVPRAFASLNSQREQTKFVNAAVEPSEVDESLVDPFGVDHDGEDQEETITGDKSLPAETVLADPEVDLCIMDGESGGHKIVSRENLREEHPYATPSTSGSTTNTEEVQIVASQTTRKKLKVMYPRKKKNPNETVASSIQPIIKTCLQCCKNMMCSLMIDVGGKDYFLCSEKCLMDHRATATATLVRASTRRDDIVVTVPQRYCSECGSKITINEKTLVWQTMDFCQEECLAKHQNQLGSRCAHCRREVSQISLGKYSVRFGQIIRQFCSSHCLEDYKKGLKVCSYCQKDINSIHDGFLAPIGEKGTFKDFCSQDCMEKYDCMSQNQPLQLSVNVCDVCDKQKLVQVEVLFNRKAFKLCSEVCFAAFKFVNSLSEGFCDMCKKYYNKPDIENWQIFWDNIVHCFCSKNCMIIYILSKRKIVPCCWCKVKKYNFDMVKRSATGTTIMACSLNCLALYQVSVAVTATKQIVCDKCKKLETALYHLTMSDATIRNFCSYQCVLDFQVQFKKRPITLPANYPTPTGAPKKILPKMPTVPAEPIVGSATTPSPLPVISSVGTLAKQNGPNSASVDTSSMTKSITVGTQMMVKHQVIVRPPPPVHRANKMTQAHPKVSTKGVACKPLRTNKSTQTDDPVNREPVLIPVPVPIYVPVPLAMYSIPVPTPVPFPLPIPVPVFVPTTRNSARGIMKEIKRIQDQIPVDPFEAELLMMAEMVASDKKDGTSSDSEPETTPSNQNSGGVGRSSNERRSVDGGGGEEYSSPEGGGGEGGGEDDGAEDDVVGDVEGSGGFGDDVIQMALKMATELEQQQPDLDLPPPPPQPHQTINTNGEREGENSDSSRGKKRDHNSSSGGRGGGTKRSRRSSPQPPTDNLPRPKPDANMCLKPCGLQYTFGVNAWKHWVVGKNAELEKCAASSVPPRKPKLVKTDVLQLTADELNYALGLFVIEARKPNGDQYTPDTIYYLCLGIQQHLFQNGRIDNIFTDAFYDKFTDRLDEVTRIFGSLFDDRTFVETRVEEEHLWETKQLGAHSPYVLLSTLMYFNTKYFNLTTVDEHMQLSFSHIMKNWKRSGGGPQAVGPPPGGATTPKVQGSRNVLLRFYPPQSSTNNDTDSTSGTKKKKVYEQQENEENPLRCPVRLYEFYLLKCPESVKSRNDVFYLQPERSCVGDSPVWYSTSPLLREPLSKMLNRIKMVKEVNVALLSSDSSP